MGQSKNSAMENEPKVIYLNCFDKAETDDSYFPVDNDFESLETENVLWSADTPALGGNIKYVHHSSLTALEEENARLREALDKIRRLKFNVEHSVVDQCADIAHGALIHKSESNG